MNDKEIYKLLKIYISEDSKYKGCSLYHALVVKLKEIGIAGVTVTRGIEGYGHGKKLHTARVLDMSLSLPVIVEAVDTQQQIEKAVSAVKDMVNEGLVITADVNVIKYGK